MSKNIVRKLYPHVTPQLWEIFKNNGVMLAGGTFERLLTGNKINDFDLYFRNPMDVYNIIQELKGLKYAVLSKTKRSLLLKSGDEGSVPINIIIMKYFDNVDDVLKLFDFECCKAGFDFSNETFTCSKLFHESISQKTLIYTGSLYPIGALTRLTKYIKRGYNPDFGSLLTLFKDLKAIDDTNSDVIEDQIGGMYGSAVDLKGLTLDQMIEKINNTIIYTRTAQFVSDEELEDLFDETLFTLKKCVVGKDVYQFKTHKDSIYDVQLFSKGTGSGGCDLPDLEFPIKLGKWVNKIGNRYHSHAYGTFEYILDEVATTSKPQGLYCGIPSNKGNIQYSKNSGHPNSVWIELEVESPNDFISIISNQMIQIKKGKVIKIYE